MTNDQCPMSNAAGTEDRPIGIRSLVIGHFRRIWSLERGDSITGNVGRSPGAAHRLLVEVLELHRLRRGESAAAQSWGAHAPAHQDVLSHLKKGRIRGRPADDQRL